MMKRYPKKQGQQPSQMMSFFGLHSTNPRTAPHSSLAVSGSNTENKSSTISEIKTIWHVMSWLFFHRQYTGVGIALVEYATKTAFSYLPEQQAALYRRWLKFLGIDVNHVGMADIGGSVLNLTFPGIANTLPIEDMLSFAHQTGVHSGTLVEHIADSHDTENTLTDTLKSLLMKGTGDRSTLSPYGQISDVISSLIHRVQSLAVMLPMDIQSKGHVDFAKYLCGESGWSSGNAKVSADAIADKALKCYGNSHWFDVGFSTLNTMLTEFKNKNPPSHSPPEAVVVSWLEKAYKFWVDWGAKWTPPLNEHGNSVVNELAKVERGELSKKTMTSRQGMFIAPIQSTNAKTRVATTQSRFAPYHHY